MLGYYMSSNGRDICIAMDYCSKGDLQMYLSNHGPISEQGTRYIIRQILQGLAMMHSEGFAHRDIKPRVRRYFSLFERHVVLTDYRTS